MANRRRLQGRLTELLKEYDKRISSAFIQAVRTRASSIVLADLIKAIEARDIERAIGIAGLTKAELFAFDAAIVSAYAAGGSAIAGAAPKFAATFGFDGRSVRAEAWARANVGSLVTEITNEQVSMLRETIGRQLSTGTAPRVIALDIAGRAVSSNRREGGFIGLTSGQQGYVENARQELDTLDKAYFKRKLRDKRFDPVVNKAIREGRPLTLADKDRILGRYSDRLLKYRADTIARTESITALRAGRREGIQQGIEAGSISRNGLTRVWNATLDSRTREDHVQIHGQQAQGMDEPFVLPDGSRLLYPGDSSLGASAAQTINCRCFDEYVVDWLRG